MSQATETQPSASPVVFDLDNKSPIDEADPNVQAMLEHLQGNILKGHGRDFGVYIFFSFGSEISSVRKFLSELAGQYVTSALRQYEEAQDYRQFKIPGRLFGNLFLTAHGYRHFGLGPETLLPESDEPTHLSIKSSFVAGMAAHAVEDFADPPRFAEWPEDGWEPGYQDEIDAMLLLADDDEAYLLREARRVITQIAAHNKIRAVELGKALRNQDGEGIEHFGYVDGRSQPLYLKSDFQFDEAGNRIAESDGGKIDVWDPFEPLRRVLVRDPGVDNPLCHGSFFVFRKLEQDVLHFQMREQELADKLEFKGEERERAGAMTVGRFEDGTPVTLSKTDGFRPAKENNFTFKNDPNGHKCPFHAHIRKTNPRGDMPEEAARKRRITRRGITYGDRVKHPHQFQAIDDLPSGGVGLLFMCFQASIRQQFAFMQKAWCNNHEFVKGETGIDPVVGQPASPPGVEQTWSKEYGNPPETKFRFEHFVRMRGGEFFFAPSILFLLSLG
jgi:Dyp-type peroxidase family